MSAVTLEPSESWNKDYEERDTSPPSQDFSELAQTHEVDEIDPFSSNPPFTLFDKLLIAFNALWLFPLRLFLFVIPGFILGSAACFISIIGEGLDPANPTPRNRWRTNFLDKSSLYVIRLFLFGFGFNWIHYKGRALSAHEAPIQIVSPHSCMLDIFIVGLYGTPSFVAREATRNLFLLGTIATKVMRTIYVNRTDVNSRMKAGKEIERRAKSGGRWPKVIIFPEGTTNNRKVLLSYKRGAFQPALPIQPLLIKYKNRLGTTNWGTTGITQLIGLFYTMCQFHNPLEIEVLDVYKPSEEEKTDPALYAKNVHLLVAKALGKPPGKQCVEDSFIMDHGAALGLPFSSCLVLFNKIVADIGLHVKEINQYLTRYASIDRNKDGWISPEDISRFLNVPLDSCLRNLFKIAGREMEKISFKQYLYTFIARARPLLKNEMFLKSIFESLDRSTQGVLCFSDLSVALSMRKLPEVMEPEKTTRRRNHGTSSIANGGSAGINFEKFKSLLECNPEYLLLYHESRGGVLPSPSRNEPEHSQDSNSPVVI